MTAAALAAREAARVGRQEQLKLLSKFEAGETVTYTVPNDPKGYVLNKNDVPPPGTSGKRLRFTDTDQLLDSAMLGDLASVERVLDRGIDVNTCDGDGITALHRAAVENNLNVARVLVERGADVNAKDADCWTPLHSAASAGNWRLANFLIKSGASVTAVNADGDLPLDLAAEAKVENVLKRELETLGFEEPEKLEEIRKALPTKMLSDVQQTATQGGDLNKQDEHGATLLHIAVCNGYQEVVTFLLAQKSINLSIKDKEGNTPLHLASFFTQYEIALQLVTKGADLTARNYLNQKPIVMSEDQTMLRLLSTLEQKQRLSAGEVSALAPLDKAVRRKSSTINKSSRNEIRQALQQQAKSEALVQPQSEDDDEEEASEEDSSDDDNTEPDTEDNAGLLAAAKQRQMDLAAGKTSNTKATWQPFAPTWFADSDNWDHHDKHQTDKETGVKIWAVLRYFEKGQQVGDDYPVSELEVLVSHLKERRTETNFVLDHLDCSKDSAQAKARKDFGEGLIFRIDEASGNVSVQLKSQSKQIYDMDLHKALSPKVSNPVRVLDCRDLTKHLKSCLRAGPTEEAMRYAVAPLKKSFYFGKEKEKAIRKGKPPTAHVQLEFSAAVVETQRAFAEARKAKSGEPPVGLK
eukprot:m.57452 g.57452  ORF g.57452 m.57452 type:complete len:637 (+) comp12744_c0_seq1:356-2266(+)